MPLPAPVMRNGFPGKIIQHIGIGPSQPWMTMSGAIMDGRDKLGNGQVVFAGHCFAYVRLPMRIAVFRAEKNSAREAA